MSYFIFLIERALASSHSGISIGITLRNPLTCPGNQNTAICIIDKISDLLLLIATPLVIVFILIGALQLITAAGVPEKIKQAKKTILYSLAGYAVVLLADGIAELIQSFIEG